MKKSSILFFLLSAALIMGSSLTAADNGNILRNPEFKLTAKGRLLYWGMNRSPLMKSLVKASGGNYIKMPSVEKIIKGRKYYGNVLTQIISKPKAGTYIYGADLSPSQKFHQVIVLFYYKGKDGKTVFSGTHMKSKDYPAPGKWFRLLGEITIPEGVEQITFCVEIRAKKAGGDLLIKSPAMQFREE